MVGVLLSLPQIHLSHSVALTIEGWIDGQTDRQMSAWKEERGEWASIC